MTCTCACEGACVDGRVPGRGWRPAAAPPYLKEDYQNHYRQRLLQSIIAVAIAISIAIDIAIAIDISIVLPIFMVIAISIAIAIFIVVAFSIANAFTVNVVVISQKTISIASIDQQYHQCITGRRSVHGPVIASLPTWQCSNRSLFQRHRVDFDYFGTV